MRHWFSANGTTIPSDRRFSEMSPNGVLIEGYFDPPPGPNRPQGIRAAYLRVDATAPAVSVPPSSAPERL